jgi:AcrR family transcriptional regulator
MKEQQLTSRKDEVLDTALALAFEGGPNRVTTVAIAKRLGLTQPALYRHFNSKAGLWAAITERLGAQVAENIARARGIEESPRRQIQALVLGHLDLVHKTPALPEIMLARDTNSGDAVVRQAMRSRMAEFQRILAGFCEAAQISGELRKDIKAQDMAALIMGVLQSLVLRLLLTRDVSMLKEDGTRLLDLQLSAFARESEE